MTQEDKNDATIYTVHLLAGGVTSNNKEFEVRIQIHTSMINGITNIKYGYRSCVIQ